MRQYPNHRLLSLPLLALGLVLSLAVTTACSEKNDNEEPDTPVTPVTPTNPDDWQTVPAAGGTVSRGDITIIFPSGTFAAETKVTVTEVTKGSIRGEDEVSTFYQLTLPLNVAKDMTVSIKSDQNDNDICLVVHAPAVSPHDMEVSYGDWVAEPTYSNGIYTATLPAFENPEETENVAVTIGLAHIDRGDAAAARTRADGNKVGNVAWHINDGLYIKTGDHRARIALLNEYIAKALTLIQGLGFKVEGDRDIPIEFKKMKDDGQFKQSYLSNKYSVVWINESLKSGSLSETKDKDLQRTIIHELFHYYQADYDARIPCDKGRNVNAEQLLMYESGAPWIEKLMMNEFSNLFVYTPMKTNNGGFMRGFNNLNEIYPGLSLAERRQAHAYAMPLFVEYVIQEKGQGDKAILELYEYWKKYGRATTTFECYVHWAGYTFEDSFVPYYHDFIDAACKGQVVPFFTAQNFAPDGDDHTLRSDGSITLTSDCYPFGGVYNNVQFMNIKDAKGVVSMKGKQLKIEQKGEGLTTTLYAYDMVKGAAHYVKTLGQATSAAPLVITDEATLNSINIVSGEGYMMYVVTTSKETKKIIKSEVIVTLSEQDHLELTPQELSFEAATGTKTVSVETSFDDLNLTPSDSWLSARYIKSSKQIEVSVQANSGQKRNGFVVVQGGNLKDTITVTQGAAVGAFDFSQVKAVKVTVRAKVKQVSNDPEDGESPRERMYSYEAWEYALNWESAWNCSVSVGEQGAAQITAKAQNNNDTYSIQISIDDVLNGKITSCEVRHTWDEHFDDGAHYYIYHSASATNIPLPNSSGRAKGNRATGTTVTSLSQTYHYAWKDLTRTFIGSDDDEVTIEFLTSSQLYD